MPYHPAIAAAKRSLEVRASRRGAAGTAGLHRTLAGSFREFQPPCRVRRARDCAPYLARFLADQFKAARRRFSFFSPVAGLVCNLPSQRALHSARRTHLPLQNLEIIPPAPAPRQLPLPPKLARGVGHAAPKHKFRAAFADTARNPIRFPWPSSCARYHG